MTVKHDIGGRNKQVLPQWICHWCNIQFDNMGSVIFFECSTVHYITVHRPLCEDSGKFPEARTFIVLTYILHLSGSHNIVLTSRFEHLEGQCHKIFDFTFILLLSIIFQALEYQVSTILPFFKISLCNSKCNPISTALVFKGTQG